MTNPHNYTALEELLNKLLLVYANSICLTNLLIAIGEKAFAFTTGHTTVFMCGIKSVTAISKKYSIANFSFCSPWLDIEY